MAWKLKRRPTGEEILALGIEVYEEWLEQNPRGEENWSHAPLSDLGGHPGEFDPAVHSKVQSGSYFCASRYRIHHPTNKSEG